MRRVLTTSALVVILAAGPVLAGQDGETRYYGPSGEYQGRGTPDAANPEQRSVYDEHGAYKGRVMTDDQGNARVYDQHGQFMGRTTGGHPPDQKK